MSGSTTPLTPAATPAPLGTPNTAGAPTTPRDQVVASAKDLPDFIRKATAFDPDTAAKWTGKALLASKTPWGTLAVPLVAYLASRYGFGWDDSTCALVAGAGVLVGSYLMRLVTELPITGIFRKSTPAETIAALPTSAAPVTQGPTT